MAQCVPVIAIELPFQIVCYHWDAGDFCAMATVARQKRICANWICCRFIASASDFVAEFAVLLLTLPMLLPDDNFFRQNGL